MVGVTETAELRRRAAGSACVQSFMLKEASESQTHESGLLLVRGRSGEDVLASKGESEDREEGRGEHVEGECFCRTKRRGIVQRKERQKVIKLDRSNTDKVGWRWGRGNGRGVEEGRGR